LQKIQKNLKHEMSVVVIVFQLPDTLEFAAYLKKKLLISNIKLIATKRKAY